MAREIHLDFCTPRLKLRRLNVTDQPDLLEIVSDPESFRYLDWETMDEQDVQKWLERDAGVREIKPGIYTYIGMAIAAPAKLVGLVYFFLYEDHERAEAEFTVVVNHAFRSQGYGTEGCSGALAFAFKELNLRRISAGCDSRNIAGLRMLEKAGLRREGEFREDQRIRDEWVNTVRFGLLARDYNARPSSA